MSPLSALRSRRTLLLLVFGFLCLLVARGAWAAAPIVITVGGANPAWGIPSPNPTSAAERARRVVFDVFSHRHPQIRLQRYTSLRIQGVAAESGILMAYAGGTAPDIVYVNLRQLRNYAGQGFLYPL